jgi:hypothetical protein
VCTTEEAIAAREEFDEALLKYVRTVQDEDPGVLTGYLIVYSQALVNEDTDLTGFISSEKLGIIRKLGLAEALHLRARRWFESDD